MSVVTLDKSLEIKDIRRESIEHFLETFTDKKENWKEKSISQSQFLIRNNLSPESFYHRNYLTYLQQAWASHHGIVFTPDILWYTLLCELASLVKGSPEEYRYLFSTKEEKQDIVVLTKDVCDLPLHLIVAQIEHLMPTEMDIYFPILSTSTDASRTAARCAFADMVSPYYNYMTLLCGISRVRIEGVESDWISIGESWNKITKAFNTQSRYFAKVGAIISDIILNVKNPNASFWKEIFTLRQCGSGSQVEVYGWFADLFFEQPELRYAENFNSHISAVNYKNLDFNRDFVVKQGIFQSSVQDEFVVPEFNAIVLEVKEPVVTFTGNKETEIKIESYTIDSNKRKLKTDWTIETN